MKINKTVLFLTAYVAVIIVFTFAGYYFYADYEMSIRKHQSVQIKPPPNVDIVYIDLPRISVTLSSSGANLSGSVRMDLMLEVDGQYASKIQGYRARITDGLIRYTQTLDYAELARPKATARLKPDLLREVNEVSAPVPIRDLVFREFVVF